MLQVNSSNVCVQGVYVAVVVIIIIVISLPSVFCLWSQRPKGNAASNDLSFCLTVALPVGNHMKGIKNFDNSNQAIKLNEISKVLHK